MGGFVTISLKFSLCPICLLMQLSVQKRGFLAVELNPNHNSCGNERWSFLLGFSSKSVSDIYIYIFFFSFFFLGTQFVLVMFLCMSFFPVLDPR